MGSEWGHMISGEIALPLARALLPGMSAAQDDDERVKRGVFLATSGIVIVLPFGFGLAALAPEFISVVLGTKWLPAAGILELLSISSSIGILGSALGPVFMVRGQVKIVALATAADALAMLGSALYLVRYDSLELVALARAFVQCGLLALFVYLGMRTWRKDTPQLLGIMLRPFLAATLMYGVVKYAQWHFSLDPFAALLLWPIVGAVIFVLSLMSLWWLLGRPQGLEPQVLRVVYRLTAARK